MSQRGDNLWSRLPQASRSAPESLDRWSGPAAFSLDELRRLVDHMYVHVHLYVFRGGGANTGIDYQGRTGTGKRPDEWATA